MKKQLLVIACIFISSVATYAQISFEQGYFINESNKKTACYIKNKDWRNNPTELEYKLSLNDPVQKVTIQHVKEFGITNYSKYIRVKTLIDRSSDQTYTLSTQREPIFKEELLFLKVLIEGEASLFQYIDGNLTRFFYKVGDSEIEQLVYKRYIDKSEDEYENEISTNYSYKQQILNSMKQGGIGLDDTKYIRYNKQHLQKIFKKYNEHSNKGYTTYEQKQNQYRFKYTFRPGLSCNNLEIRHQTIDSRNIDVGKKISFRVGMEIELVLPFNKNKWSLITEPTYQYYKAENTKKTSSISGGFITAEIDYKSIELPVGIRHYIFLNNDSKIFVNIAYIFDFYFNSSLQFLRVDDTEVSELAFKKRKNIALGIGYEFKDKYSIELRYHTGSELLDYYMLYNTSYKSINLIFGIKLF